MTQTLNACAFLDSLVSNPLTTKPKMQTAAQEPSSKAAQDPLLKKGISLQGTTWWCAPRFLGKVTETAQPQYYRPLLTQPLFRKETAFQFMKNTTLSWSQLTLQAKAAAHIVAQLMLRNLECAKSLLFFPLNIWQLQATINNLKSTQAA